MALFTDNALGNLYNYKAQLAAFQDFLQEFKTSASTSAADASDALENLNIGEDGLSDEYDFVEDAETGTTATSGRRPPKQKYMELLQRVANREEQEICIDMDDLWAWERATGDPSLRLVDSIEANARHYIGLLSTAVDSVMPPAKEDPSFKDDVLDVLLSQREKRNQFMMVDAQENGANSDLPNGELFPPELTRRYTLVLKPRTPSASSSEATGKALAVRYVRGEHLGRLITVRGIATRVSDVKPAVEVNAYTCDRCGSEIFQPITTKQFTPMQECPSRQCKETHSKGQLFLSTRASKFVPFQEVKLQEMADQVPVGHIPRTLTVHCHGTTTRRVNPGDIVDVAGIFLPTPYTGFKAIRAGLLTDTYLEAQHVRQHKKAYDETAISGRTLARIEAHRDSGMMYEYLARSIAPEIFGHLDVKKALLLLLIGGVTKDVGDGMKIRGDINVCLMGDPGVAKSQLLKYITKVAPRGVYTTGRGSSGVGLTAAVLRDPATDEMVLEGGALVLADNGICCIDEFDKMDDGDRTAIHEVMEQQTISISKAGITTTLNARTSILAAANPLYGRYNPRISPVDNINLPAALLSRFDIMFLMLDQPSRDADEELARHVTYVHMHNRHPEPDSAAATTGDTFKGAGVVFTPAEVRQYVARARTFRPTVPREVHDYVVGAYVRMRQAQRREEGSRRQFSVTTPRTLLGVIRLSQALARLRFATQVVPDDVDEALRLIEASKQSLVESSDRDADRSPSSKIYALIRGMRDSGAAGVADADGAAGTATTTNSSSTRGQLSMRKIRERVLARGFTNDQFVRAIDEYMLLDVWQTAAQGTRLVFIEGEDDEDDEE